MNTKKLILSALCIFSCLVAYASDIIVLTNSTRIDAKILEVSETEIKYKKVSNPDGPTFIIKTDQISSVIYENGEVTAYSSQNTPKEEKTKPVTTSDTQSTDEKKSKENKESIWKFNPQPSDHHIVGLTLGYASKTVKQTATGYLPTSGSMLLGRVGEVSPAMRFGLTINPTFIYGIGLRTAVFMEYTREHYKIDGDPNDTETAHDLTFSIPLQLSYRYELIKDLSFMIYTGPVFDFGALLLLNRHNDERPYGGKLYDETSENLYSDGDYIGFNALWGIGAGIQWKNLRLDIGGEFGMINKAKDDTGDVISYMSLPRKRETTYKNLNAKWNKPIYVTLTWMF